MHPLTCRIREFYPDSLILPCIRFRYTHSSRPAILNPEVEPRGLHVIWRIPRRFELGLEVGVILFFSEKPYFFLRQVNLRRLGNEGFSTLLVAMHALFSV